MTQARTLPSPLSSPVSRPASRSVSRMLPVLLCASLLLSLSFGCVGRSPETFFYVLNSDQKAAPAIPVKKAALQFRRIDIPGYLDRNAIVTRSPNNVQVTLSDYHQWAESLGNGMRRVLAEVMAPRFAEQGISLEPFDAEGAGPLQFFVQVLRFDGTLGGETVLEARWTLRTGADKIIAQGNFAASEPAGLNYESLVKAQSSLLVNFGEALIAPLSKASLSYAKQN